MYIDAHVHLFDPRRPGGVPWPPRDSGFYRPTLPQHLRETAAPVGCAGAVVVECSRRLDDNHWLLDQAKADDFVRAIVGYLDPRDRGFPAQLERFAANPLFRGIRLRPEGAIDFESATVRENLSRIATLGLAVDFVAADAGARSTYLPVVRRWPGIRFMFDHFGHPSIDGKAPAAEWNESIGHFAALPNCWCKVSRLTEAAVARPAPELVGIYTPVLDRLWNTFGPDRLLFGSNWPPCLKAGDYCTTVELTREYLTAKDRAAVGRVMASNAARFYGGPRLAGLEGGGGKG